METGEAARFCVMTHMLASNGNLVWELWSLLHYCLGKMLSC